MAQKKGQLGKEIDSPALATPKTLRAGFVKLSQNKNLMKLGLAIGLALIFVGLFIFIFNLTYQNRIMPKTYFGDVNLGGKTKAEASVILQSKIANVGHSEVQLNYLDQNWKINSNDFNVNYNVNSSVDEAWRIGREGSFNQIIKEQLRALFLGNRESIVFNYDRTKLNSQILEITNKIDVPERDATIEIKYLNPIVVEEKSGKKSDFGKVVNDVLNSFGYLKEKSTFQISVVDIQPKVKKAAAEALIGEVRQSLVTSVILKTEKQNFELKPENFAGWLKFTGQVKQGNVLTDKIDLKSTGSNNDQNWILVMTTDQSKINQYLDSIAGGINQEAKDAKFQVQDGKVTAFQNSQTGYELDKAKSFQMITQAILGQAKTVSLPVKTTQPKVTSDSAEQMGLSELVGEGKTSWKGSPSNRIHNLTLGSQKISGTIIQPGQEFSTIKTIGVIDGSTGFLPELVIKNSTQVAPEYGGGLCQVSTTLFRAALNSGLKITQRTNHSFRVSYYEPPVGMDATIYDPAPDFRFVNNMSTPILIWAIAGQNTLEFQIYGTKDGRTAEISTPWVGNYTTPGGAVYSFSATMAPGAVRQVEKAINGCTASFTYKVTAADGKVLENETFTSKYVPVPNTFLYGEGYTPPSE